jgi:hypothetical protein
MGRGRLTGFLVLGAGAVVLLIVVLAAAGQPSSRGGDSASSQRDARFDLCRVKVGYLPAGFSQRDSTLRNLGNGVMGRSLAYGHRNRSAQVHMGYDALDAAEDLDIKLLRTTDVSGRTVEVYQAAAVPSILAATWEEGGLVQPCSKLTVFGRHLTEAELLAVVDGVSAAGP